MGITVKSAFVDPAVQEYIIDTTVREHPVLRELREATALMPEGMMEIGPEQGAFMTLLARTIRAKRYLEIGVFTGYSALAMALAMPDDGRVVACDVDVEYTSVARRYWERADMAHKIDLHLAPALETLDRMIAGNVELFDMAFIDADKENAANYYERCLRLLRPNGLLLVDNVIWSGRVVDPSQNDASTTALRALNAFAGRDDRVDVALLPLCDGLLIARKKDEAFPS